MQDSTESRRSPREKETAQVYFSFEDSDQCFGARVINTSRGGMCFQTGYAISPGKRILVCTGQAPPENPLSRAAPGVRPARVQWCSNVADFEAFFYRVGIQYVK